VTTLRHCNCSAADLTHQPAATALAALRHHCHMLPHSVTFQPARQASHCMHVTSRCMSSSASTIALRSSREEHAMPDTLAQQAAGSLLGVLRQVAVAGRRH
jgi:hypothetical protein